MYIYCIFFIVLFYLIVIGVRIFSFLCMNFFFLDFLIKFIKIIIINIFCLILVRNYIVIIMEGY